MTEGLDVVFDPWRLAAVLCGVGAEFLVVGSTGAWAHGASRRPRDLDCVIRDDWANFNNIAEALRRLGARPIIPGMSDAEARALPLRIDAAMVAELPVSSWMTDAGEVDLFDSLIDQRFRAVGFEELAERSVARRIGSVTVDVASVEDLIAAKEAAARALDAADLVELRQLRAVAAPRRPVRPDRNERGLDL